MSEAKEKASGTWNGKEIRFSRVWRGHRFSDSEVSQLLQGLEIEIHGLKAKSGNEYGVKGKLSSQTFVNDEGDEIPFVGFEQSGFVNKEGVPKALAGHTFPDEEREKLEAGEKVFIEGFTSKKGSKFDAWCSYGVRDGEDRKSIIFDFDKK